MKQEIKEYLRENKITTEEALTTHIVELKRNTVIPRITYHLIDVLVNEKDSLLSFFAESNLKEECKRVGVLPIDLWVSSVDLNRIEYPLTYWGGKKEEDLKDDVITSSSKGEKENAEFLKEPYKESKGKLYYELSWGFIEAMAQRMQNHKNGKYELYNWKKPMASKGIDDMKQALNRHHIEVMKGNYDDGEEFLGHVVSYATNSMILWEQLKLNKS
jgi:hypothetical protein